MDALYEFANIRSYADVEQLVSGGVPEDLHLEYKSGRPKNTDRFKQDVAQDISAFANSDGGTLVVGVTEVDNKPAFIDGIDPEHLSRESLGQVLATNIRPTIAGLSALNVNGPSGKTVLIVSVPKSESAPHQGPNHKYYRRYEHHNQPLAHHEIEDLSRRRIAVRPLITVSTASRGPVLAAFDVRNSGDFPADDIQFEFSSTLIWAEGQIPEPLANGMRHLGPGQRLRFRTRPFPQLLSNPEVKATFTVRVEYTHSFAQQRLSHVWPLDFEAYRGSMSILTDEQQDRKDANEELTKMREALVEISRCIKECFPNLVGANGLDLSIYTLTQYQQDRKGRSDRAAVPKVVQWVGLSSRFEH